MSSSQTRVSWETRTQAVVGVLKALGFEKAKIPLRRLCEAGEAQLVLEASAEFLLSVALIEKTIPQNAGMMTKDLAVATEAALLDLANQHALSGSVLVPRYASVGNLHAELCKQWIRSFSAPIPETYILARGLEDPEIQARLTVVALKLREKLVDAGELRGQARVEEAELVLTLDELEGVCSAAALAMFLAFQKPNETNHQLIHGSDDDAG
jgi:hypothetical protein